MLCDDIWFGNHDYTRFHHMVFTDDTSFSIVCSLNFILQAKSFDCWFNKLKIISTCFYRFCDSCETAAGQNITKQEDHIKTSNFYFQMGIAQFAAWSSFAASVGLTVFALLKLVSDHQIRNMKASMYLERQRLVNDDAFRTEGVSEGVGYNYSTDSP